MLEGLGVLAQLAVLVDAHVRAVAVAGLALLHREFDWRVGVFLCGDRINRGNSGRPSREIDQGVRDLLAVRGLLEGRVYVRDQIDK